MRRLTRSSGVHRSIESDEQEAEDVTAILNEEAAGAARPPSRKRRRTSSGDGIVESPPTKRLQLSHLAVATTSPRRQSGRLQARKSLSAPTRLNPRNPFDFPSENGGEEATPIPTEPVRKLRLLKKTLPQNTASPFQGHGELVIETNARINLDASPKKGRGRPLKETNKLAKIAKSLQGRGRLAKNTSPSAAAAVHADEDDIFGAAERGDHESSPQLGEQPFPEDDPNGTHLSRRTGKPLSRRGLSPRSSRAAIVAPSLAKPQDPNKTAEQASPRQTQIEKHRRPATGTSNPLAAAAKRTEARRRPPAETPREEQESTYGRAEEADDDVQDDGVSPDQQIENGGAERDSVDDEQTENGNGGSAPMDDEQGGADHRSSGSRPRSQRPQTEAARAAANRQRTEEEERPQQMIEEELAGIEEAVELHGCKELWAGALVAAAEVAENMVSTGVQSTLGKACDRSFKQMISVFKRMDEENPERQRKLTDDELEKLGVLVQRCNEICRYSYRPDMYFDRERQKMVRDLYGHLIRRSLKLSKSALKASFRNNRLSAYAIEKICQLLGITEKLVDSAGKWTPRPGLESGVKGKTKSETAHQIQSLRKRYNEALVESGRSRWLNEHNRLAMQSSKQLEEQHRKWRESIRAKYYRSGSDCPRPDAGFLRHPLSSQQAHIVDVDDIVSDEEESPNRLPSEDVRQAKGGGVRNRSYVGREPTEDIPAPDEPTWSDSELTVLSNGLQQFTGESRWEEIMNKYSRCLGKYDMDGIVAKARWFKQIMASKLEHDSSDEWDWLRSVPD
ncbi:hypothetical protein PV04_10699 [Phialophora macrospora]|uniref:Uncharacterized protein n=1 Tax=Phialophora macrospora TaxID=1851006 RepID=A0A0D2CBZ1_9EURO|nr:hypothetical protein PV04_10699 [Phialophora macrospora]